jgi:sodium/potassium-transporting ATPase subunit alpha
MVFMQYGNLLAIRNRRVSLLQSNPLWGPRKNYAVPIGMVATALIAVINLYGPGLHTVFNTTPIPGMFWGPPFAFALGILCVDETRKLIVRTYPKVSVRPFLVFSILMEHLSRSLLKWPGKPLVLLGL